MTDIKEETDPNDPETLKFWIKRTYWDYLCAYRYFLKTLEWIESNKSLKRIPEPFLKYIPNFSDFKFSYDPMLPCGEADPNYGHIKSPATSKWLRFMTGIGFRTIGRGPFYGNGHDNSKDDYGLDFGIAVPDNLPMNGEHLALDPVFSCCYMGKKPVFIHDLPNDVGFGLSAIAMLRNIAPDEELQPVKGDRWLECMCAKMLEGVLQSTLQYVDFTMCPVIERIRRYHIHVLESDLFSPNRDPKKSLSEQEQHIRKIAKLRDECFAHNMHHPATPDNPMPQPFTYRYTKDGIVLENISLSVNRSEIQKCVEASVIDILGYKSLQELESDLANHFPDLSQKLNGGEPAVFRLVEYIASNVHLASSIEQGYSIQKSKDIPKLLKLVDAQNQGASSAAKKIRDMALHDHFPFEEFYGQKMMSRSNVPNKSGTPRFWKGSERVAHTNISLIETALNGQREDVKRQLAAQKQPKLTRRQRRRLQGGR